MGPGALTEVLCGLKKPQDPRLLVGIDTADDAGVYLLNEETALIQTLDFFTPLVDDAYLFGQIAAANSLSDVYAMGGKPLTAMNIVAFPIGVLPNETLREILRGGQDKVLESGAVLVGGHTVEDKEPKFGLSVTGVVHPSKVLANSGAKAGDALVLTKALGSGILMTAAKAELFLQGAEAAIESMRALNKIAAEVAQGFTVHACTDITGFGLLGHAREMAAASGVDLVLSAKALPLLPEVLEAAAMGLVPGGAYNNREYLKCRNVTFAVGVSEALQDVCFDPQTSGGLLFSLPQKEAESLLAALHAAGVVAAKVIGFAEKAGRGDIHVDD